jgi:polysaccharide export outer membrane protein
MNFGTLSTKAIVIALLLHSFVFVHNDPALSLDPAHTGVQTAYHIEPGDLLEIIVLGREELSRKLMVMRNGTISYPLTGELHVEGLTTKQAAGLIAENLEKYFTNPIVSVFLQNPTAPHISVFGEVTRPGTVDYQRGLRLTDYLALAGGVTSEADIKKVKLVRFINDRPLIDTINVDEILNRGEVEKNYELKSGDWIFVSKKFKINWGILLQITSLIIASINLYFTIDRLNS